MSAPFPIVFPGSSTVALRRHHGGETEIYCQLAGFIVFTGPVHDQGQAVQRLLQPLQELQPLRGIVRVAEPLRQAAPPAVVPGHVENGMGDKCTASMVNCVNRP